MNRAQLALLAGAAALAGCSPEAPPAEPGNGSNEPQFTAEMVQVAAAYRTWGRVDDGLRAAVLDCRAPVRRPTGYSAGGGPLTHGQKFYTLYAKHRDEYLAPPKSGQAPVGQAVVKETWLPVAAGPNNPARPGEPAGLFVMMKLDPTTAGTDAGWVYGTVSADGKTVTAAGKLGSCMKCHQDAGHDRLFGLAAR